MTSGHAHVLKHPLLSLSLPLICHQTFALFCMLCEKRHRCADAVCMVQHEGKVSLTLDKHLAPQHGCIPHEGGG